MKAWQATTSAYCRAARKKTKWSADRCWPSSGSITLHTKFKAEAYVLTKEGAAGDTRRSSPDTYYSSYFRTTDVTGDVKLPDGVEMVMPGDNIAMEITLITPVALEKGLRFAIREGGHTVGAGAVAEIIE